MSVINLVRAGTLLRSLTMALFNYSSCITLNRDPAAVFDRLIALHGQLLPTELNNKMLRQRVCGQQRGLKCPKSKIKRKIIRADFYM